MGRTLRTFGITIISVLVGMEVLAQSPTTKAQLALVGGTIYPSPTGDPIRDGVVLIEGDRILAVGSRASVRVPRGSQRIDCTGLTITAGFWNSHVHFLERKWSQAATLPASGLGRQLQAMITRYGFTSVFDTWSMWENTRRLRDRIESGEIAGPRIRSTGQATFPKGAAATPQAEMVTQAAWGALGFMPLESIQIPRVAEPSDAVLAARQALDAGADGLKLYAVSPGRNGVAMPDGVIRAVVKEGHGRGKPVFAHPTTAAGLMASVGAGVDVVAHTTPQSGPWGDSVVAAMRQARVALIPTLSLWRYELRHDGVSLADGLEDVAVDQLRAWVRAGGDVLFGTDVGYMTAYDPTDEYALMARAGMTFRQILASLTTAPAERFGASTQLGRLAPGFTADLTVLRDDPSKDVRALATVEYTIRDGKVVYQSPR